MTFFLALIERLIGSLDPAEPRERFRRILVIDPAFIGDAVMTSPVYRALKAHLPGARVEALMFDVARDVFVCNPYVDAVRVVHRTSLASQLATAVRLRRERYDLVVNLYTGLRMNFLAWITGAPARGGYNYRHRGCFNNMRVPIATRTVKTTYRPEECLTLLERLFGWTIRDRGMIFEPPPAARESAAEKFRRLGLSPSDLLVGIHANSNSFPERKRWGRTKFAALADRIAQTLGARVVFTGTDSDREYVGGIVGRMSAADRAVRADGELTLPELGVLISSCACFISIDTGPLHIAIAVGTPTLALLGGIAPSIVLPENNPRVRGIAAGYAKDAAIPALRDVTVDRVAAELEAMTRDLDIHERPSSRFIP